ncbi:MAG: hypothetical protein GEU86_06015 [Actinophytocola sp.]|nr:hypothetical protein [Actinophytocola sp.]
MTRVDRAGFRELVRSFSRSAFRWECQGVYHEPSEKVPFRLWQEGRPDYSFMDSWVERVRGWRVEGKTFERVRMVTDPPTDYLRWMFEFTHLNVEAGEDIRWLAEADAKALDAPTHDYYLFDDDVFVILEFGDHGVVGADIVEDAVAIEGAQRWRRLAWANAMPHDEYMSRRN